MSSMLKLARRIQLQTHKILTHRNHTSAVVLGKWTTIPQQQQQQQQQQQPMQQVQQQQQLRNYSDSKEQQLTYAKDNVFDNFDENRFFVDPNQNEFLYEDEGGGLEDYQYLNDYDWDLLHQEHEKHDYVPKQRLPTGSKLEETAATAIASAATANVTQGTTKEKASVDTITVPKDFHNARLDRFLRTHFKNVHNVHVSNTQIQKAIRKRQILINGTVVKEPNARVTRSHVVTIPHALAPQLYLKEELSMERAKKTHVPLHKKNIKLTKEQIEEIQSWVLFKNKEVIVLNKPYGLAVQGGTKQKMYIDGMLHALRFDNSEDPKLVHRLDKETSGVLVLARNRTGAHRMQQWFMNKDIGLKKCYWCLVIGKPKPSTGRIKNFLEKVSTKTFGEKVYAHTEKVENSKIAITEYKTIDSMGEVLSWLSMYPITGRLHQLRVHCATTLGTPILGDEKYSSGLPDSLRPMLGEDETLGTDRASRAKRKRKELKLHLHARAIALPYFNEKGERIIVSAPLPEHMKETFKLFGWAEKKGNKLLFK